MKIGIVTFTTGDNFGQRLQNYALQEILESKGCIVYTLRKQDFRLTKKYWLKKRVQAVLNPDIARYLKRHKQFVRFDNKYIKYVDKPLQICKISKEFIQTFDRFVVGSDQVWSPQSGDVDEFYFLTFANDEQKYCYAPSFSVNEIPREKKEIYKKWISSFRILNCREYMGQSLLKQLGFESDVVLDPTLLVDKREWKKIAHKPKWLSGGEKYLLKYYLGKQDDKEIKEFANSKGCLVIDILDFKNNNFVIGPSEFLYLIEHAEIVFTDSYHGTIFSILLGTPFVHCKRKDELIDMSSRFKTLFEWFKICESDTIIYPEQLDMKNFYELKQNSMKMIDEIAH